MLDIYFGPRKYLEYVDFLLLKDNTLEDIPHTRNLTQNVMKGHLHYSKFQKMKTHSSSIGTVLVDFNNKHVT